MRLFIAQHFTRMFWVYMLWLWYYIINYYVYVDGCRVNQGGFITKALGRLHNYENRFAVIFNSRFFKETICKVCYLWTKLSNNVFGVTRLVISCCCYCCWCSCCGGLKFVVIVSLQKGANMRLSSMIQVGTFAVSSNTMNCNWFGNQWKRKEHYRHQMYIQYSVWYLKSFIKHINVLCSQNLAVNISLWIYEKPWPRYHL